MKSAGQEQRQMPSLLLSDRARTKQRIGGILGRTFLVGVTSVSMLAVLLMFWFIAKDAIPFFRQEGFSGFFTSTRWYPSAQEAEFGALAIFFGTLMVTTGAVLVAVPLGVIAAVCLSDILSFRTRQWAKPVVEMLAAVPSVVYGFFALVVLAPLLQEKGGILLECALWTVGVLPVLLLVVVLSDVLAGRFPEHMRSSARRYLGFVLGSAAFAGMWHGGRALGGLNIVSGTNALNVSIVLGVMALPTIVSVSEDALQAVGRELREGSYALGATRAETVVKIILPAARSGVLAAIILGVMRVIGETMVVWMASGNSAHIPEPWYNFLEPIRTMTATIAGDMGEADQVTGSSRYHVLFALALFLLIFAFISNLVSERFIRSSKKATGV